MVLYFTSSVVTPPGNIYVGKDKVEKFRRGANSAWLGRRRLVRLSGVIQTLILRHADLELRFHADKLSSAHIYLRLPEGSTWETIDPLLLEDLAQLTKANSIEGNKKDNVTIIYTPWTNLKKDGSMAVGQVGFKNEKLVKRLHVAQRQNPIVNRLNRTKTEREKPDLRGEKEERLKEVRKRERIAGQERKQEEARVARERAERKWQKDHAYDEVFTEEALEASSNQDRKAEDLDDFM